MQNSMKPTSCGKIMRDEWEKSSHIHTDVSSHSPFPYKSDFFRDTKKWIIPCMYYDIVQTHNTTQGMRNLLHILYVGLVCSQ